MKKLIALLLAAMMTAGLCACGNNDAPVTEPPVSQTDAPAQQTTENTELQPTEPEKTAFDLANECIDKSVEELYELIGEPQSSDYVPSCLNPGVGEDGNLYYEGFVVYTYREGDKETVTYVEKEEK